MITSKIVATGAGIPERVVTNDDLSKLVDTSDEWIQKRTGIRKRHISEGEDLSHYTEIAARQILERAGVSAEEVELIIVATVTADYGTPSAACMVQKAVGAVNAVAFDVTAACSGFLYAVSVADKFLRCGVYHNALVIGGEILSKIVDWSDRSTCVLFGDGVAGAFLVQTEDGDGILEEELGSKGEQWEVLTEGEVPPANIFNEIKPLPHPGYIYMDGREVFKFATNQIVSSVSRVLEKAGLQPEDIAYFVPHQANSRIIDTAAKKLKIDRERFYVNIEEYGNTSSASIPLALNEMNEKGLLKKGDLLILCGFGGGLTWGTILLKW